MTVVKLSKNDQLIDNLIILLGEDSVITDKSEREFFSSDVYASGITCSAVISPKNNQLLSQAVTLIDKADYAIVGRGGGMSYTKGYLPTREDTIVIDLSSLNNIIEVNTKDMYITVQAGVTWKQIYDELKPTGYRLPFFGTFSGIRATVGGGLSQGALFFGTARYGQAADIVLGIEVIASDGSIIKTGQGAFQNAKPFYRTYGPDLTGLFLHDGGSLGIKTQATLRLIKAPNETEYATFVFNGINEAAHALSEVARSGAAEEAYVFDPESTQKNLSTLNIKEELKTVAGVLGNQSSVKKGIVEATKLIVSGKDFIKENMFSLHVVCAGRSKSGVNSDIECIRDIVKRFNAEEISNSIPKAVRSNPFKQLNGVIGPAGDRWAALNAKVPHSKAIDLIDAADKIFENYQVKMKEHNVSLSRLLIAIDTYAFSYEPVLHWFDEWLPVHKRIPERNYIKYISEPKPNPEAANLVEELRNELAKLFADFGASSNQIGRTYPYMKMLDSNTAKLLKNIKNYVDPEKKINPGVLGL